MSTLRVDVPRKLRPLLAPRRYKGAYGGRGGAKSHFFAEQVILRCYAGATRVVCIREVQQSIRDSVRQLLVDKITKFGLEGSFEVLDAEIRGPRGSLIVFRGMQSYNAANIKSLEGYDVAWVEEAQTLSQHSLDLLRPTLRKKGSELWFSWNPRYKTDPVDAFFRDKGGQSDPDILSVQINWKDNPWFPDELRRDMERDFADDPDKADHVWNGAYGAGVGAILARWVNKADREGRIHDGVEYDPDGSGIVITSDLGFRDTASWWFWQPCLGGYRLLKYIGDSGFDADDWIPILQKIITDKGWRLGRIWLPHDARAKTFQSKHTSVEKFLGVFPNRVSVVPQTKKADQISAARRVIGSCEFHKTECEDGIDGLSAWEFEWNEELNVFSREPLHNWASHPADGFAYGCQVMEMDQPASKEDDPRWPIKGTETGFQVAPLNDLWKSAPKSTGRI